MGTVSADLQPRTRLPILALLTGTGVSIVGSLLTLVAVPWFVLQLTGSAAKTGITTAVWVLPVILSGAFAGPLVDRLGYRQASILGDLGSGLCVALIPLLDQTSGLAFWMLLVLVFWRGLFDFPGRIARRGIVPELAALAELPLARANATFAVIQNLALLAGPALAGILIAAFSASRVLWIDALTYAFSALMTTVFVPATIRPPDVVQRESYREQFVEGFRFVRRSPLILTLLVFVMATNFLLSPLFEVDLPVYARRILGSPVDLGLMSAGYGAGSLTGALLYGVFGHRLSRRVVLIGSMLLAALPFAALALLPPTTIAITAVSIAGLAAGPVGPLYQTVIQERVPAAVRGRVFGLNGVTFAALPAGVLLSGALVEAAGLRFTLIVQGAAVFLAGLVLLALPILRRMD